MRIISFFVQTAFIFKNEEFCSKKTIIVWSGVESEKVLYTETNETNIPVNIYLLKVNNKNTNKRCEICSYLTINTPVKHH